MIEKQEYSVEEVDLDYVFMKDEETQSVYIRFDGFVDKTQMEQFAEYMQQSLPLLFTTTTRH
jgi:hypothetical protein